MNIEKAIQENNSRPVGERMPIEKLPADYVQDEHCMRVHSKKLLAAAGHICHECGDMVCGVCGCTDSVACDEGCSWVEPGICSSHEDE